LKPDQPASFGSPIFVTRPVLPDLEALTVLLREIWASGRVTNDGPYLRRLRQALRRRLKTPGLSLVNNGTTGLLIACRALGLTGEVITTPFTFPATVHALAWSGLQPVFADIDPSDLTLDPTRLEKWISNKTTAILAVHIYGNPCRMEEIQALADRHGLKVIYDAAQAFGVEVQGEGIGSFGDLTLFSFHATKSFHTLEGGLLAARDRTLIKRIDLLKNFGIKDEEMVLEPGINGKMNEFQAAIGLLLLREIEKERRRRKQLLQLYRKTLEGVEGLTFLPEPAGVKSNYQYAVVRIEARRFGLSRDGVYRRFRACRVFTRKYFYPLCSTYPCYRALPSSRPENLPVAQRVSQEVLCLPLHGGLKEEEVQQIGALLKGFQRGGRCRKSV
jgi:dTDP-4-amino-4,6-dideoxygalactose transaminase